MFTELQKQKSRKLTFGDNGQGNILGIGETGNNSTNSIDNVYLVDGLKYNLLSILQLCYKINYAWLD